MVRSIAAVLVSYIVMGILMGGLFIGMWYGLGMDRLLKPGSFDPNMTLNILAPAISVFSGVMGGLVCAKIGRSKKLVMVLAVLVLVLGLVQAFFTLQQPLPVDPRDPSMTMTEFRAVHRQPSWFAIFSPIGGAIAVLVGGLVLRGKKHP